MAKFTRSFDVNALAAWDSNNPGNAVRELFNVWCLPGFRSTESANLRVGVRAKYLNFYVKGQSVAKLSMVAGEPKVLVHQAYVSGKVRDRSAERVRNTQSYETFGAQDLASPRLAAKVKQWVTTAETYASAEKRFVDDLIGANPGVIDVEMALPANAVPEGIAVAPRMDLVVAQVDTNLSIAFWEAKCSNNPELRAENKEPKVFDQVQKYLDWVSAADRIAEVQAAYRETAKVFLALHRHFRGSDCTDDCGTYWNALSEREAAPIIGRPGVVIAGSWPEGAIEQVASDRMQQAARSFVNRGHSAALEERGVTVHIVGRNFEPAVLPLLTGRVVNG
ncbi:hypothetical protein [Devosia sp. A16]|uniref:hypothetical protein n=1 Tax=Devosia sp. A16 TaxID=1736675 RepID=UPI000A4CBECB|nr:hypothetical protein [Devosia sp. A16]